MAGRSSLVATAEQKAALQALSQSDVRGEADRARAKPCCMEQTCRRSYPSPARGSGDAHGDREFKLRHAVEDMDGNVHLGRPALVRA